MGLALTTPTVVGLYINNLEKLPGGNPDTDPYNYLLGTDGFGASTTWGNKIDNLINYMVSYGYNYALFYDLHKPDFIGSVPGEGAAAEAFSASGQAILENIIPRFKAFGISVAAICDVFKPNEVTNRYDGTSQIRKIHKYNQDTGFDANKTFDWINFETEFWNYRTVPTVTNSTAQGTFRINNTVSGLATIDLASSPPCTQVPNFSVLSTIVRVGDLIEVTSSAPGWRNLQIRQIVDVGPTYLVVDRPWELPGALTSFPCATWTAKSRSSSVVDYSTFLYRVAACTSYLNSVGSTMQSEAYVGFPDYVYGQKQLADLYQIGNLDRILLTDYVRIPNWSYINASYSRADSGATTWYNRIGQGYNITTAPTTGNTYRRVTDDIIPNIDSNRVIGTILSAESSTKNNSSCITNCQDNNFSGYFFEGRSKTGITSGNLIFRPLNVSGVPIPPPPGGECCGPTPFVEPEDATGGSPFDPRSIDDSWKYIVDDPMPSGAGYAPGIAKSYNKAVTDGDVDDTNLTFDTLVVFTQSIMRTLVTDPPIPLLVSINTTNASCSGSADGAATVVVTSGTAPFTYTWYKDGLPYSVDGPTSDTTSTITGLDAALYACDVEDGTTAIYSVAGSVLEPAVPVWNMTATDGNCAGENGTITVTISGWTTGPLTYTPTEAYIQITGNPVWFVLNAGNSWTKTYTGLTAGAYGGTLSLNSPGNSCDYTDTASINAGTNITAAIVAVFQPECFTSTRFTGVEVSTNSSNFPITHSITFTNSGLTYTSGPINSPSFVWSNLPYQVTAASDTITYTATDGLGCIDTDSVTFNLPTEINVSVSITQPTCAYSGDGSINLTVSGGETPYSYLWSNGETTQDISNLYAGTYNYIITDDNGCQITGSITLTAPTPIILSTTVVQIPEGETTGGSISVDSVSGGTAPYTYLWSTGDTTNAITNLSVGTYTVTVTDDNGCETTKTFNLYVRCDAFDLTELKVAIYKAQCCAGKKAQQYIKYLQAGREDLALCKRDELRFLTMAIDALYCITDLSTGCFTCEQIKNILDQIAKYCDCDCCEEADTEQAKVDWDIDNNKFNIIE